MSAPMASLPHAERSRERLWSLGPAALTTVELIAVLLGTAGCGRTPLQIAARLLEVGDGSLRRLAQRPAVAEGIAPGKAGRLLASFEIGARLASEGRLRVQRIRERGRAGLRPSHA